jgi:tetratricopeptide (TPR) repeat protein
MLAAAAGLCAALCIAGACAANPPPDPVALKRQAEAFGDSAAKADALAELAKLEWQTDPDAALRHAEEGLRIAVRVGHDRGRAASLNAIGVVHYLRGDYERARGFLEQSLALHKRTGNTKSAGSVAANLGHLDVALSRHAEALALYEQAVELSAKAGDEAGVATAKDGIGSVLQSQGRFREAIAAYQDALAWSARAGDDQSRAVTLNNLANCQLEAGNALAALEGYLAAAELFEKLNLPLYQALAYSNIAPILVGQGLLEQGRLYL